MYIIAFIYVMTASALNLTYEEEFEDPIEEDIPEIENSGDRLMGVAGKIGESHGITVS